MQFADRKRSWLYFGLVLLISNPMVGQEKKTEPMNADSKLYSFTVKTIDGTARPLSDYKGKVLLIVNVASECGFTPQYKGLEEIYRKYKDKGFVILGFPSNDFGEQEPGTEAEIKKFCESKYDVTFDLFSKGDVKGENITPLYSYLTKESESAHAIQWNFNKFLVDRDGRVVGYYPSKVTPTDSTFTQKIEVLLANKDK